MKPPGEPESVAGVKDAVYFRVEAERKERWEEAALVQGLSLTTFLGEAADKAAEAAEKRQGTNPFHKFIRNLSREATQGGASNYAKFGQGLACNLEILQPGSLITNVGEWWACLKELERLLFHKAHRDDAKVWAWFEERLPDFMKPIPTRRRDQFVQGVYRAWDDGQCKYWVDTAHIQGERTV
jgi:hypothetical protein